MHEENTPVLIVGGGPVGLSTAMFLGRHGIPSILVEQRKGLSVIPRATGLHARTLELFREVGLEPRIAELGMEMVSPGTEPEKIAAGRATPTIILGAATLADLENATVLEAHDLVYDDFTPSRAIWCGQDIYEPFLLEDARAHGADARFHTEFLSLEQDADGVRAVVQDRHTNEKSAIRAKYLIAADGVRSATRSIAGIGQSSHGDAGDILSIVFRAKIDFKPDAPRFTWFISFDVMGMLLIMERDRWMLSVIGLENRGWAGSEVPEKTCLELVRQVVGDPALEVTIESAKVWTAVHMVADEYRSGRVFLAGDACHAHPPSGGYGVNAGIQDAHNLAWKIAAVVNGWAGPTLLDTYEAERRPIGEVTANQAWLITKARISGLTEEDKESLRDILPVTAGYRYNSDALIGTDPSAEIVPKALEFGGWPGTRAPHAWLQDGDSRISTIDLFGREFVLLTRPAGAGWHSAGERVASALGIPVRCVRIGPGGDLVDIDGEWAQLCGISDEGALLVRPDGFVAWRSPAGDPDPELVLSEVLSRVAGRA